MRERPAPARERGAAGDEPVDAHLEEPVDVASLLDDPDPAGGPPPRACASGRKQHWRQVLAGSSPREVLARLLAGDPLALQPRVAAALRSRALLLDADRALLRTMARCARMARRYRGHPELERWLDERVDEALLDLVREDAEGLRPEARQGGAIEALSRPLGLDPAAMGAACAAFNLLSLGERRAFHDLVIAGRSLDALAAEEGSATEIARRARRALEVLLVGARGEEGRP